MFGLLACNIKRAIVNKLFSGCWDVWKLSLGYEKSNYLHRLQVWVNEIL